MTQQVKLTAMAKAAGCAAKLNPATLDAVLRNLPQQTDPNVLVGFETNDDAGVYLLAEGLAMVQTVDFFTPIVDDPYLFGQIAAANALSDVYAMGGRPVSSLSIVGFPEQGDPATLEQILRGGLAKMTEAQCSVIGGTLDSERRRAVRLRGDWTDRSTPRVAQRGRTTERRVVVHQAVGNGCNRHGVEERASQPQKR